MTATETSPATLTAEARNEILARGIAEQQRHGWHIDSQGPANASLSKGKPTSHLLHLILSLLTVGLWIPVWICVSAFGGQKHRELTVDTTGRLYVR